MKSLYLSIIVIVASLVLPTAFGFGINTMPDPKFHAVLDKNNYQNSEKPFLSIFAKPNATINLLVLDSHGLQKLDKNITLENGTMIYSFDISSYSPGVCSVIVEEGMDEIKLDFTVGLTPTGGGIVLNTDKNSYFPGDNVTIFGWWNSNTMIKLSLIDPDGVSVKSMQIFSDKTGHFSSFDFSIPSIATTGTWKIYGTSGVNNVSVNLTVENILGAQTDKTIVLSPLKQFKSGIAAKDIECNDDLQLIFKTEGNFPTCVKTHTAFHLLGLGWGYIPSPFMMKTDLLNSTISGGKIKEVQYDIQSRSIIIKIQTTSDGSLMVTIPKFITDLNPSDKPFKDFHTVLDDGMEENVDLVPTANGSSFTIPFVNGTQEIEIIGNYVGMQR
ncbi:MAG: hypothetical protein ACREA1_02000 [Nitrosotalea sp.]